MIRELLKEKAKARLSFKDHYPRESELRNYIFGIGKGQANANATKIIPWINKKNDNEYEYGYISLILLDDDKLNQIRKKVK